VFSHWWFCITSFWFKSHFICLCITNQNVIGGCTFSLQFLKYYHYIIPTVLFTASGIHKWRYLIHYCLIHISRRNDAHCSYEAHSRVHSSHQTMYIHTYLLKRQHQTSTTDNNSNPVDMKAAPNTHKNDDSEMEKPPNLPSSMLRLTFHQRESFTQLR